MINVATGKNLGNKEKELEMNILCLYGAKTNSQEISTAKKLNKTIIEYINKKAEQGTKIHSFIENGKIAEIEAILSPYLGEG